MTNYNMNTYEIKREIQNFSNKLSIGLAKPKAKFISDFLFGLNASSSTLISNIARELKEDVKLGSTIERLCDNIHSFSDDDKGIVMQNYYDLIQTSLDEEVVLYIDDSDITKPYGKKFEDLSRVVDGSAKTNDEKKKTELGYYMASTVVLSKNKQQPIPLYNNIYSLISEGVKSKGDETMKSINQSLSALQGKSILLVGDRGYDDRKIFRKCLEEAIDFNIRLKGNRKLWFKDKWLNAMDIAQARKGKIKMELYFQEENKSVYISYTRVGLEKGEKDLTLLMVYGISEKEPLLLLTSKKTQEKQEVIKIVRSYFSRWRIEEYFRFIKSEEFENIRIRTIAGMNVVSDLIVLRTGQLSMMADKIDRKLLVIKIVEEARAIKKKVSFWCYQISKGIRNILKHAQKGIKCFERIEERSKYRQLSLRL